MLPEFTCNFLATLAHPPWTTALRRDLYMTVEGEERTPFSLYVQPSSTRTGSFCQTTSLSHFSMLPPELQLRILTFCSTSTLFQLMQVSSVLRAEASKLFWARSDAYFLIEARWLLDGGYPSYTYNDLAFLANVQNVQIEYRVDAEDIICPLRDGVVEVQPDQIAYFWTTFTKRCPNAKRAVVNQSWTSQTREETTQCVPEALQLLIRSCPPKIAAFAFIAEKAESFAGSSASALSAYRWQRAVYQPGAGSLWEKVKSGRDWKTVLVPAEPLPGLVGRFQECQRRGLLLMLEEDGLWPILVEALDRYHFDDGRSKSFSCPLAGCDGYFRKAGEWTVHAAEMHNQDWIGDECLTMLPQVTRSVFEKRRLMLAEKGNKIRQEVKEICKEWKAMGEEQQRTNRQLWVEKLREEQPWQTENEVCKKSQIWQEFQQELSIESNNEGI